MSFDWSTVVWLLVHIREANAMVSVERGYKLVKVPLAFDWSTVF